MSADLVSYLNDMAWNDLRQHAKDKGVTCSGNRAELTSEILKAAQDGAESPKPLGNSKSVNIMSPKLMVPKSVGKSAKKGRTAAAAEKLVFVMPEEPVNNEATESRKEDSVPAALFPEGFTSNAGPPSPQVHRRCARKAMIRSPSPVKSPEPAPRSAAKSATKARSSRKSITKERKPVAEAEVAAAPEAKEVAEATVAPEARAEDPTVVGTAHFAHGRAAMAALAAALLGGAALSVRAPPAVEPAGFGAHSVSLDGPSPMVLLQGDAYVEHGVALSAKATAHVEAGDGAAPTVTFEYSSEGLAFSDSVGETGTFEVTYSVDAAWFSEPVKIKRTVIVRDVDECTYAGPVDALKHNCAEGTTCSNTDGGFACN